MNISKKYLLLIPVAIGAIGLGIIFRDAYYWDRATRNRATEFEIKTQFIQETMTRLQVIYQETEKLCETGTYDSLLVQKMLSQMDSLDSKMTVEVDSLSRQIQEDCNKMWILKHVYN